MVSDLLTLTSLVYCIIFSNPILLFSPLSPNFVTKFTSPFTVSL
ncbi:hypothetical protein RUMLAC_01679 [[Ruminococcus] lactaris ATCC 29176]|uniref:Uncharacterized protein n=1 Tax=[Ruminococcus] lactaris ATCC 29176 TaxID=471875 RepID=B5CQD4_9FIRM|nr:hypothetical protein RUMLAC_01679 [[Ruminococcus] lactaris ATCC 29176]